MRVLRQSLGVVASVFILLSSAAHSLLGGKEIRAQLVAASVKPDLVRGVMIGWHFGGAVMLALGVMTLVLFIRRLRRTSVPPLPLWTVALLYLGFGAGAFVASGFEAFFAIVFVVPGLLLAIAAPDPA